MQIEKCKLQIGTRETRERRADGHSADGKRGQAEGDGRGNLTEASPPLG